jgi:tetratricopeptide (TPR) repeat protein
MLAVKMRLEDEVGKSLVDHYNVKGFPSIVFVDNDSMEIDRIIGYRPPDEFLEELIRVQRGEGTIPDLIDQTAKNPHRIDLSTELASKYEDRGDLISARDVWQSVAEAGLGDRNFVHYKLVELNSLIAEDVTELEVYIAENMNSEYSQYAFRSIISIFRKLNDKEGEADAWRRYINLLDLTKTYTPSIYNSFAWRMSELEMNFEKALEKIRDAIKMTNSNNTETVAGYKDTEAEVLWKMGRIDEALQVIDECIELQPDDQYFKDQKEKFLKSK